jgi:hypothetical protein
LDRAAESIAAVAASSRFDGHSCVAQGRHVAAHGAIGGVEPMCQFIGADPRMGLDELQ